MDSRPPTTHPTPGLGNAGCTLGPGQVTALSYFPKSLGDRRSKVLLSVSTDLQGPLGPRSVHTHAH